MAVLLGSQAAVYLQVASLYFAVALIVAAVQVARRPIEALWVGFFLLAVTSQTNPVQLDELGTSIQGAYRPYILVVVLVAGSMLIGECFGPSRTYGRRSSQLTPVWRRFGAFVAAFLLALVFGYFRSFKAFGLTDVLRESSGWITFLLFLLLGYRLSTSVTETQLSFTRLRLAVLVYSVFFVTKFVYLSLSLGADQTASGYGYSQRDAVFFSALVLVLLIAQALASGAIPSWRVTWPAGLVLLLAVLLSGSRSVLACIVIVTFIFALVWRSKARLRLAILGIVVTLACALLFGAALVLPSQDGSQAGVMSYVSNRFLIVSAEDGSLLAHVSEMEAVADAVRENPVLGKGPLASYSYFDPTFGWKESTYLDSGLGYLLMKTGLLGTLIFTWFAMGWLKMAQCLRTTVPALRLATLASFVYYLVFLLFGPSFFEFQHAWLVGLVAGHTMMLASKFPLVKSGRIPGALNRPVALA